MGGGKKGQEVQKKGGGRIIKVNRGHKTSRSWVWSQGSRGRVGGQNGTKQLNWRAGCHELGASRLG